MRKARFLKVTGITTEPGQVTIDRARQLASLKGYVTNLPASRLDGTAVIAAYHDLRKVEQSFRMTKSDLRARPVFHHQREVIEARLTVVFAALAVARHLQDAAGTSIKKIIQALRTARSATIEINGQRLTLDPDLSDVARDILKQLECPAPGEEWDDPCVSLVPECPGREHNQGCYEGNKWARKSIA